MPPLATRLAAATTNVSRIAVTPPARAARYALALLFAFSLAPATDVAAQSLDDLTRVQPGRSRRISSAPADAGSNRDNLWVAPGETRVLANIPGPAKITHIWLTFSEAGPNWISQEGSASPAEVVLRMYWDDADEPAVESPLGDFFAAGFGVRREIKSVPVQVESGDGYNCFWPMPFRRHGRITITNESEKRLNAFYFHVDYVELPELPADTAYFCAQYRQEFPEQAGRDYLILDAEGTGHYVGTVVSARSRSLYWFGEGDDKFYIDGDEQPSLWGTGTEDYFLCAWGMNECSFPYFGCTFMDGSADDLGVRYTLYRWHVADPIRFQKSLRFEIEHAGWISADETESGKVEGFVEREDDIASVAFWYQVGRPKRFTKLPPAKERVFPNLDLITTGAELMEHATHAGGELRLQAGGEWTATGQLFYLPDNESPWLESMFHVEHRSYRGLVLRLTHSYDYGRYQVFLDGAKVGEPLDLYAPQIEVRDHYLGSFALEAGPHKVRFECVGKNESSRGRYLGVDSVRLRERWEKKRPALRPKE